MKTSDLIKQAEELLGKCSAESWVCQIPAMVGPSYPRARVKGLKCTSKLHGSIMVPTGDAEFIVFARNHMQELLDKLKKYEEALIELLGWQSMAPTDIIENARKALDYEGK